MGTRRDFITSSGLGLGAIFGGPISSFADRALAKVGLHLPYDNPYELPAGKKKLGIALVGLGGYATKQLAPALKETKLIELRAVVTGSPETKGKKMAKEYGFPEKNIYTYETMGQLANNPEVDVIYIVLPNSMHAQYTIMAAQAGKHVICEKPMALNVNECQAMMDACKKAGVQLSIGYRLHFEPFNQRIMEIGQKQLHGKVHSMDSNFSFTMKDTDQWRAKKARAGGGPLMDLGIYCIQAANYTVGREPVAVTAKATPGKGGMSTIEETIHWELDYGNGLLAKQQCSYVQGGEWHKVKTDKGLIDMGPVFSYNGKKAKDHTGSWDLPQVYEQVLQMDAFADCILNNKPTSVPGEMGMRDVHMLNTVYKAAASGQVEMI